MKVLFLAPLPYVASMPFAVESIDQLAHNGHTVDVLTDERLDPPFGPLHPNVRLSWYRGSNPGLRYVRFMEAGWTILRKREFDLIVGLSPVGLVAAALLARRSGTPYVFYNDEISFGNERGTVLGNAFGRLVKMAERWANGKAAMTVTQDPERGRFVAEVNRIPLARMRFLPNSRSGIAAVRRSSYLRDALGIAPEVRIVLWIGHIGPGTAALELARRAVEWPASLCLVFHSRSRRGRDYVSHFDRRAGGRRVYVVDHAVGYGEVDQLVASADIGLGLYPDRGVNARYICRSSGKINHFLMNGTPCIVSRYEGLQWVADSGAGVCVDDPEQVLPAIQEILRDYSAFQSGAVRAFEEYLSFDGAFAPILREWVHTDESQA